ncbi:MAG TPA: transporter substrate-binding domain-containing protein [Aliidongia sp.]|uniref:substrate-binding periplasmic protein n=1 Tax=Aliidongia sp. TaxID=1914230 RepID=UPI002DDDA3AA|nr:transporter substrate-binding domain-containing protein [Aliidongia sp.]HEV2673021.1 transporter substrate-binding domain-containing protein [Aliidongia sp.]
MLYRAGRLLLLAMLAGGSAQAAGLRLVTGTDYPPYAGPELPAGGMATELAVTAFGAAGVAVEPVEFLPWKRGYQEVLNGEFDLTFPYVAAPDRNQEMVFSAPLYDLRIWPVFRADRMRSYTGPQSLVGLTLCQPVGYAQPEVLHRILASGALHLVQPASMQLCARQLLAGRVDLLIDSVPLFNTMVMSEWKEGPPPKLGDRPVESNPLFALAALSNPKAPEIVAALNKGIAILFADGRYDAIVRRHMGGGEATETAPEPPR